MTAPISGPLLMSVDPGISNGFAMKLPSGQYSTCTFGTLREITESIRTAKPARVVVERFHGSGRMNRYRIRTIEIVGGLEAACSVLGIPLYKQMPQERTSFVTEAKEIMRVLYGVVVMTKDQDDHEVSALSHLLCHEYKFAQGMVK